MKTFIYPATPVDTTGLATEAKQDVQIVEAALTNTKLDTIITQTADVATETTLAAFSAKTASADFTLPYDTLQVTAKTADGPTTIVSKIGGLAGTIVQTKTIVYDVDGDFESSVVS